MAIWLVIIGVFVVLACIVMLRALDDGAKHTRDRW